MLILRQNEGDLSVKHLGRVRRPAPSAGSCLGRGRESLPLPVSPGYRPVFSSEFTKPSKNAERRADLLVLVDEGANRGLQIYHLSQRQVGPTGFCQVFDLVYATLGCHCVGHELKFVIERTASPARDGSAQPQSSRQSAVEEMGAPADLVLSRRLLLWMLIQVATACTVTLPHPGRLPRSL